MKVFNEIFDITDDYCIIDIVTDKHVLYYEFDNNHKIIDKMKFKLPTLDEWLKVLQMTNRYSKL